VAYSCVALSCQGFKPRGLCFFSASILAGPLSQTHRELWAALSSLQPLSSNITMPALIQAEAGLNNRTVALLSTLLAQSSSTGGTELGIANGVWTKQLPVLKGFADNMWRLYRVSCWRRLGICMCGSIRCGSVEGLRVVVLRVNSCACTGQLASCKYIRNCILCAVVSDPYCIWPFCGMLWCNPHLQSQKRQIQDELLGS
jgi:hypothetical protein